MTSFSFFLIIPAPHQRRWFLQGTPFSFQTLLSRHEFESHVQETVLIIIAVSAFFPYL